MYIPTYEDVVAAHERIRPYTDQPGRHYYELETRWVQDKKSNCASEVGVVEDILDQLYQADADAFISCVFPGAGVSP